MNDRYFSKLKTVTIVLLVLVLITSGALSARIIYLNMNGGATDIVPDNLIAESNVVLGTTTEAPELPVSPAPAPVQTEASLDPVEPIAQETTAPDVQTDSVETTAPVIATTISLYKGKETDNERFNVSNMFPGDSEEMYYSLKVNHSADVTVYFTAAVTEQSRNLSKALHICVTHLDSGKVLYDGALNAVAGEGCGVTFASNEAGETVAYYKIEAYLPASTGNEYQNASLNARFDWFVKDGEVLDPPPTGDSADLLLWLGVSALSFLAALLLILSKRREKEDENA